LNKNLQILLCLPYTYNAKNSEEIAEEIIKLPINEHIRVITLDIKDMYVNLPITGTMQTTKFWLNNNNKKTGRTDSVHYKYHTETKLFPIR
jgi:hypothetical protein